MSSRHVESAKKDNRLAYALAQSGSVWPLAVFIALAAVTAAGMVLLSYVLGSKRAAGCAEQVYESGMTPVGSVREDVPVHYWRVATMFVIFDVEAIFIITWALGARRRLERIPGDGSLRRRAPGGAVVRGAGGHAQAIQGREIAGVH